MEEFETESCIFCTNCFDRKPDINCDGEAFENFKGGFNLFCKLLGVNVNCDGGSQPCCGECLEALTNLVRLEKIIVETRERQTEVVQLLRAVTVTSATDSVPKGFGRTWTQLRDDLFKALQRLETKRYIEDVDESSGPIHSNFDNNHVDDNYINGSEGVDDYSSLGVDDCGGKQTMKIKNCWVSLTRVSLPLKPVGETISPGSPVDGCGKRPRGTLKRKPETNDKTIKKRARGVLSHHVNEIGWDIAKRHSARSNPKRKTVPTGSELSDSEAEEEQRGQRQIEIKQFYNSNVTEVFKRKLSRDRRVIVSGFSEKRHCYQSESDDLFLRLRDDLFLHKHILVSFTQNKLVCQEEDCNYGTTSEDNCVSYDLFEEFRKHVNESHKLISRHLTQTCPLCPKMFYKRCRFKSHLIKEHSPPAICNSCWKPYKKGVVGMMRHVWRHKNEEEKEFATALGYTMEKVRSRKKVSGDPSQKNIFCDQCPRRFGTEPGLKIHQKVHLLEKLGTTEKTVKNETDFRKFECHICDQQFLVGKQAKRRQRFERHMRSHSDNFSFICETCGKGFVSKDQLRIHVNVHSEEPQFPCEFCGRKYKHPRNLHLHKQKEHGDMLEVGKGKRKEFIGPKIAFPCEFCDRIFPYRGPWANHLRKEHAEQGLN